MDSINMNKNGVEIELSDRESRSTHISNSFRNVKSSNGKTDDDVVELNFKEGPLLSSLKAKAEEIISLSKIGISLEKWIEFALSDGGLISDEIRRIGWPALLGLDISKPEILSSEESLREHPEYSQVVLDVNRSLKRFPPGIPYKQRVALQDQLTNLILRVITKYPHLRYYQGYHDVAITFLLVVGEELAFRIMEKLSTNHLRDCMEPTMEKTSYLLNFVFPLIKRLDEKLCDHLEKSGAGTMFCLPWFLTWFGHSLNHYKDVVRLYDFFLASPPLMPLYLTSVIVHYRAGEIFALEPDMATVHCFLSQLPDNLPFDKLVIEAVELYKKFPPSIIEVEVQERTRKEKEAREREEAAIRARRRRAKAERSFRGQIVRYFPTSRARLFILAVSIAVGIYAYLRGDSHPVR